MADTDETAKEPAGGLAALTASARSLAREQAPLRGIRSLVRVNQPDGFDCPGCAWPEPRDPGWLEFCENGAKAVAFEATGKRAGPDLFATHTVSALRHRTDHWLEAQGRLTHPMRYDRGSDTYRPVSWDEAFAVIGAALDALEDPDQAVFYTSGRTSNEAAFLYQLLGRRLGTNNFPDCSNMCHESSGVGLGESIGIGKGTVTLEDFAQADAIFVIGQNPGTNHPRMLTELLAARRRGARIVSMNPLRERALVEFAHPKDAWQMLRGRGTAISTHYLQVQVGGDLAALKGIAKRVLEAEDLAPGTTLDHEFLAEHTSGFDDFADDLRRTDWETIERASGLTREELGEAAQVYLESERVIACWAMGLTQQPHAVATIQQIANLLLLRGNVGRAGAGLCPVRGHSNVQGDRTVGITEKPSAEFLERLGREFGFAPPTHRGFDTVASIGAMAEGRVRSFMAMGGNFLAATPDTEHTARALERCGLTVHVSTKLNRSHTVVGREALILPCLGRTEIDVQASGPQRVTVEDSMSVVHASSGRNPPASPELRSEPAIVAGIARATKRVAGIDWDGLASDYTRIRERIAAVLPELFHDFESRIGEPGGFYLGNSARERRWSTETGRARFVTSPIPDTALPSGQLRLMTIRSHDQFNTTIYDLDDRYRGIRGGREVIFLHADDLAARGLRDGQLLEVTSHFADGKLRSVDGFRAVAYDIPRGCAAGYFPELNPLVSVASFAARSRTPTSKLIPVTIRASSQPSPRA
ncbi:MAG: FdhF/YdeP family oxidoreductase [Deltaproteobacteria bacterium]|nr:FdhF/YdeP family oxidoreductase [Deltaproteobacteria bacterium]